MALEDVPGGFAAVYPVLRAMEEAGKIRRGHFVEGYAGAQFAWAAAVDGLRAARTRRGPAAGIALAAQDPAQPFGALLPWPEPASEAARPRRAAGATVVLVGGEPVLFAGRGARTVWTFPVAEPSHHEETLLAAARALAVTLGPRHRKGLRVETIDAEPAASAPAAEAFVRTGWRRGYRGLELDRHGIGPGAFRGGSGDAAERGEPGAPEALDVPEVPAGDPEAEPR